MIFESPTIIPGAEFIQRMDTKGVKFTSRGGQTVRAVTHRMISEADVDEAIERISLLIKELN